MTGFSKIHILANSCLTKKRQDQDRRALKGKDVQMGLIFDEELV